MSEELRDEAPTGPQNSTQEGFFIPSHFNFSIEIKVDPELVDAIKDLAGAIRKNPEQKPSSPKDTTVGPAVQIPEPEKWHQPVKKTTEETPGETAKKYEKSFTKTKREPKPGKTNWKAIPGTKHAKYAEDGQYLTLKYLSGSVRTTWKKMLELSEFVGDAYREARDKNMGSIKNPNQVTAINQFVLAIQNKTVTPPKNTDEELEETFSQFQAEEDGDPDAAFRPMLTPHYSTRPDGNSGKVEGDMGAEL